MARRATGVLLAVLGLLAFSSSVLAQDNTCQTSSLEARNRLRAKHSGTGTVQWDDRLQLVTQDYANTLASQNCATTLSGASGVTETAVRMDCNGDCGDISNICGDAADFQYNEIINNYQFTTLPLTDNKDNSNNIGGLIGMNQLASILWKGQKTFACAVATNGNQCLVVVCRMQAPVSLDSDANVLANILPPTGQQVTPSTSTPVQPTINAPALQPQPQPQTQDQTQAQPQFDRVVSVADLHGDLDQTRAILRTLNIIDQSDNWIAGRTKLVQTGDLVDRGDFSMEIVQLFGRLKATAPQFGGQVVMLTGNHEMFLLQNNAGYVSPTELTKVGGEAALWNRVSPTGVEGRIIRDMDLAHVSRDAGCNILYVHGAAVSWMIDEAVTATAGDPFPAGAFNNLYTAYNWNQMLRKVTRSCQGDSCWGDKTATDAKSVFTVKMLGEQGMVWSRAFAVAQTQPEASICADVAKVTQAMGVDRIVSGHNIQWDGTSPQGKASVLCGGKLIIADIAMSRAYNPKGLGLGLGVQCSNGEVTLQYGAGVGAPARVEKLPPVQSAA